MVMYIEEQAFYILYITNVITITYFGTFLWNPWFAPDWDDDDELDVIATVLPELAWWFVTAGALGTFINDLFVAVGISEL